MGPLTRIQPFTNRSSVQQLFFYSIFGRDALVSWSQHVPTLVSQGPKQVDPRLLGHIQSRKHKTTPDKMASLFIGQKAGHLQIVSYNQVGEYLQRRK